MDRYKSFLGIQPDAEVNAEADALKRCGDFTSPDDPQVNFCCNPPQCLEYVATRSKHRM